MPHDDKLPSVTESVTMDSKKFLSAINNSAQSQIAFYTKAVADLGEKHGSNWQLSGLLASQLVIEDLATGDTILADYSKQKGGRVTISNFRKVQLAEGNERKEVFESACLSLVEAIETGKNSESDAALSRIAANRFRGTAVPNSGVVKTKDEVIRFLPVVRESQSDKYDEIARLVAEALLDTSNIVEGKLVASYNQKPVRLPVSELTKRRAAAYRMRECARSSYWTPEFQTFVESIAGLVSVNTDKSLEVAVARSSEFLTEQQEYGLLNKTQLTDVVGNALATHGVFNDILAEDVATLIYKTNLKVNKSDIVDAWKATAKVTGHPVFLENVTALANSSNIEEDYDHFLGTIFEAVGDTTRESIRNGLVLAMEKLPEDKRAEIKGLIEKLSGSTGDPRGDEQAVWDGMDLLSKIDSHMGLMGDRNLNDFTEMPGGDLDNLGAAVDSVAPPAGGPTDINPSANGQGTVININTSAPADGSAPAAPDLGAPPPAAEPELDLPALDGAGSDELPEDGLDDMELERSDQPPMEDIHKGTPLNEEDTASLRQAMSALDLVAPVTEPVAPVAPAVPVAPVDEFPMESLKIDKFYGMKMLTEAVQANMIQQIEKIIGERKLKPEDVNNHIDELAGTVLAGDSSLKDPKQMQKAKEELIGAYTNKKAGEIKANAVHESVKPAPKFRGVSSDKAQKLLTEGRLNWAGRQGDGVLGTYKGVHFVLDHASPVIVSSVDGMVEVPIPESIVPAALYLAEVNNTETNTDLFVEWLDQNIEQLRPTDPKDMKAIEEAIAKLTVSPDVTLEVSIDKGADEPEVITDPITAPADGDVAVIEPVTVEPVVEPVVDETPTLPPFEGAEDESDEDESEDDEEEDDEDEEEESEEDSEEDDLEEAMKVVKRVVKEGIDNAKK